jgi:hypothetical protein
MLLEAGPRAPPFPKLVSVIMPRAKTSEVSVPVLGKIRPYEMGKVASRRSKCVVFEFHGVDGKGLRRRGAALVGTSI